MEKNNKTLFQALYHIEEEVEGLPISYGSWGLKDNPACWLTYNDGDIQPYDTKEQAKRTYYNMLRNMLKEMQKSRITETIDTDLPW